MPVVAKTFAYAVEIDRGGRMTIPGGAQIEPAEGWTADHLLIAGLVRCAIDSLGYHARRGGHEIAASGSAHGTVGKRPGDGRYALLEADVRIEARLTPRSEAVEELVAKAERDCFVGASLSVAPRYEWHIS